MSEADSQNTPLAPVHSTDSGTSSQGDWQTIDFPGAISVDAIPCDRPVAETTHSGQELAAAQARVNQLFHELELSHRAAQRQQILVETLNDQLSTSQERIAQLERDCALTQQRHNEQVQQRLQAENICRDLRMRLHRQQQQTLQFKVALEKCLEMPAQVNQYSFVSPIDVDPGALSSMTAENLIAQTTVVQSQPVQPWSASSRSSNSGLGFLPSKASNPDLFSSVGLTSVDDRLSQPQFLSDQLIAEQDAIEFATEHPHDQSDLTTPVEPDDSLSPLVADLSVKDSTQEPEMIVASDTLFQAIAELDLNALLPDDFNVGTPYTPLAASSQTDPESLPEAGATPASPGIVDIASMAQSSEPTLPQPLNFIKSDGELLEVSDAPTSNSSPSPIVYPTRPSKKLKSLAAVELPTFPRPQ